MQSQEFDNLLGGRPAMWADLKDNRKLSDLLKDGTKNKVAVPLLRDVIARHEEPIPQPTRENIDAFILKLRTNGMKESKIRRIVKNKFRITVI